jgi:UDP-glucose 4-epimerase
VRDVEVLVETFRTHDIFAVMHFAASSAVGESVVNPEKYYANNVAGSLALLRAMREVQCMHLVFSSTGAVYGNASREPIREDSGCEPVNPYGSSKRMIRTDIVGLSESVSGALGLLPLLQRKRRRSFRINW